LVGHGSKRVGGGWETSGPRTIRGYQSKVSKKSRRRGRRKKGVPGNARVNGGRGGRSAKGTVILESLKAKGCRALCTKFRGTSTKERRLQGLA